MRSSALRERFDIMTGTGATINNIVKEDFSPSTVIAVIGQWNEVKSGERVVA